MLSDDLKVRIEAGVPVLDKRIEGAADLTEILRQKALPNAPVTAFIVPLGLNPRAGGESSAGAFTQMIDEVFGVVLVLRSPNDVSGTRALPRLDALVWEIIDTVCGWAPEDAVSDFRLLRGRLLSMNAGTLIYQLDFAIQFQLRILS